MNDTLPERIAGRLRRAILLGDLRPGDSVKERDNASELGVSRTPMREAIRQLAKEGLIILRPSRSPIVANPTLKEVVDDLTVLRALEVLSGELACQNASITEIEQLRKQHEHLIEISATAEPLDFFEIDMAFHRALVEAAHNPSLKETHGQYLARLWRVRYLSAKQSSDRDRSMRQHGMIVSGLEARDATLVARELSSHIHYIELNVTGFFHDEAEQFPEHRQTDPSVPS